MKKETSESSFDRLSSNHELSKAARHLTYLINHLLKPIFHPNATNQTGVSW